MKHIKNNRWLAGIAMILFVFGVFFIVNAVEKTEKSTPTLANQNWHFNGAPNPSNNNPLDPSQYSLVSTESCDEIPETVCMINAPANSSNSGQPNLSSTVSGTSKTVSQRIQDALNSEEPNETVEAFRSN